MIVLDTNVLSETLRAKPSESMMRWMRSQSASSLFTTTISEAEILYGVALMPTGRRRTALQGAVAAIFAEDFADRILVFDSAAARAFAGIAADRRKFGRPIADLDTAIAAIALSQGASVATRNVDDFADCGIALINPWQM
jgi:toxin FitB